MALVVVDQEKSQQKRRPQSSISRYARLYQGAQTSLASQTKPMSVLTPWRAHISITHNLPSLK